MARVRSFFAKTGSFLKSVFIMTPEQAERLLQHGCYWDQF